MTTVCCFFVLFCFLFLDGNHSDFGKVLKFWTNILICVV